MKKPVAFVGDAKERLRDFPQDAKRAAGYQLDRIQAGGVPDDYRPMPSVGQGVLEIRIREDNGVFRIFYVANRPEAVYVLHCFQKKTQKTSKKDIDLGRQRYKDLS